MSTKIASLYAEIGAKTEGFEKGAKKVKGDLSSLKSSLSGIAPASLVGFATLGGAIAGISVAVRESVLAASDLEESMSKVGVVFGNSAEEVYRWADTTSSSIGISRQAALEAAGTYGNLFTALGLTKDAAADMSQDMVNLAADLASFNNADPTQTLEALRAGLTGEAEPLKRYGVAMNQVTLAQKAMEMGLGDNIQALTEAQKIQLRYAVIMEQTGAAQGDFARTSDGLANTMRTLNATTEDLKAELGEAFLPTALKIVTVLTDAAKALNQFSKEQDKLESKGVSPYTAHRAAILGFVHATEDATEATDESSVAIDGWGNALGDVVPTIDEATQSSKELEDILKEQTKAYQGILDAAESINRENERYAEDEADRAARLEEIAQEKVRLQIEQNAVQAAGNLDLAARNDFMMKQIELDNEHNKILEDGMKAEEDLKEASNRRIFDMVQNQVSAEGISTEEYQRLQDLQVQLGLVTRADADRAVQERLTADQFAESISDQKENVTGLLDTLRAIPENSPYRAQVIIDTYGGIPSLVQSRAGSYSGGFGASKTQLSRGYLGGFQGGGSFIVPGTGIGDRPYMLGLSPGERVDVTSPDGKGGSGNTIIINATVSGEQDWAYVAQMISRYQMK